MRETIGDRIRLARESRGLDQIKFANLIGIAARTLQRWEKGEQVPDSEFAVRISKQTRTHVGWILTGEGPMRKIARQDNVFPLHRESLMRGIRLVEIPVLASVPAGTLTAGFTTEHAERYVTVDDVRDPKAFALVVKGTSMSPRIENGDIVVVSPQQEVRSGDICVIRVNDEDVLKKIKIEGAYVHLIPLNPVFDPVTVKKSEVSFIWKVVKVIKSL